MSKFICFLRGHIQLFLNLFQYILLFSLEKTSLVLCEHSFNSLNHKNAIFNFLDLLLKSIGFSFSILCERIYFCFKFSFPQVFGNKCTLFNWLLRFKFINDGLSLNLSSLKDSIVFLHFSKVCSTFTLVETIFFILFSLFLFDSGFKVSHNIDKTKHWLFSFS